MKGVNSQIAILVCSDLALQICKFASLKQLIANELVTTRRTCSKLVASNTLQTIAKTEYADEPHIRTPDNELPKPDVLTTQPEEFRLQ
ncbi:hypothetical protein AVEN_92240-1 [Araneus ventricosus]|uniref:Uncharacterized protein n=1 Tax=Araneus ventricosus TaxID=182803 RepID=A0A4Y2AKE5_ARAVE|nr:hypothetical protein AVEN_92240-1 [Araneus ventricosus]